MRDVKLQKSARSGDLHITIYQLIILLNNFCLAIEHPKIGYNDADTSIKDMLERYRRAHVNLSVYELEKLFYACNMMNEEKKFWHPGKDSFDKFLYDVSREYKFDKVYNKLEKKKEKESKDGR
jgi:hypothetical protein